MNSPSQNRSSRAASHVPRGDETHSFPSQGPNLECGDSPPLSAGDSSSSNSPRFKIPTYVMPLPAVSYHFLPHPAAQKPRNSTSCHLNFSSAASTHQLAINN